jgi:signal transduction histidine kinase
MTPAKIKEHEPTAVKREMEERITETGQTGTDAERAREIARSKVMAKEKTAGTAQTDKTNPGQTGTDKLSTVSQKLLVAGSRKTEVWYGADKIVKRQLQIITKAEATVDYCHSSESPSILVSFEPFMQTIVLLHKRGVRQRYITEITKENVKYCKQLAKYLDLRHLDGVKGTLGIIDSKIYGAIANTRESHLPTEFVYSNVKEFVDQQQYFFETLWNKAIPAERRIREIEEGIPVETTEIIDGTENILNRAIEGLSLTKERFDNCIDHTCPPSYVLTGQIWNKCIELWNRGVRLRFISEITSENISYCKEIMKIAELRHLDRIRGNFGISDGRDYRATARMQQGQPPIQAIRSTIKTFVDQQQYFFETLWNKAVPGEKKIREIEEGIPTEVTEIWYGLENITKKSWDVLSRAKRTSDYCHDSKSPAYLVSNENSFQIIKQLRAGGIRQRFVTEITNDNVRYCKELAKYVELRHLDGVKGNFGITDSKEYGAAANIYDLQYPLEFIYSNVRSFVDQQQYFFDTLWSKAIPADKRIREIEEGVEPETVQTLNNSSEIQNLANQLVGGAKKELLIVFPTAAEFYRQHNNSNGFLKKLMLLQQEKGISSSKKEKVAGTLDIRIAVPGDNANDSLHHFQNLSQKAIQEKYYSPMRIRSEIRYIDAVLSTNVAVIIVDRKHSLVIEVKDDKDDDDYDYYSLKSNNVVTEKGNPVQKVHGLAIYTNSSALVMSTVSMFELLWTHIELYEELKLRDIERREFIDVAAHELRGPLQPILGLTKEIRSRYDLGKDDKMLGAILKSAANLQKLANNILDVARIESKSLELKISKFDLNALVRDAIDDCKYELQRKNAVKIQFRSGYKHLLINADKHRIHQVVYNLLANAIKFTHSGLISISAYKKDEKIIIFSVRDTGQGIEEEIMPKLFEKFATSPARNGTGLGLFISRKIIDAHGGNIYGINNPAHSGGKGATFTFTLPVVGTKPIKSRKP